MGLRLLAVAMVATAIATGSWPAAVLLAAAYLTSAGLWDWQTDRQITALAAGNTMRGMDWGG